MNVRSSGNWRTFCGLFFGERPKGNARPVLRAVWFVGRLSSVRQSCQTRRRGQCGHDSFASQERCQEVGEKQGRPVSSCLPGRR
jgi:hypothetical protein